MCERNFKWNMALWLYLGRWGQEEDVEALAEQWVRSPVQQISYKLHSYHMFYCKLDKRGFDIEEL